MDLLQNFRNKQIIRSQIKCPEELSIWLDHCEYAIHKQFDKSTKQIYKMKKRKKQVNFNFQNAIQNFNREQKVEFYLRLVNNLQQLSKGVQTPPKISQVNILPIQGQCQCRSFNLKIWKLKKIRLDRHRYQLMVQNQKDNKIKTYELRNYLLRKSKIKDRFTLVLEAINDKPNEKSRTVHISFKDSQTLKKWFYLIKEQVEVCEWLNVKDMLSNKFVGHSNGTQFKRSDSKSQSQTSRSQNSQKSGQEIEEQKIFQVQEQLQKQEKQISGHRKTFIDHLVDDDCVDAQDFFQELQNQTEKDVQQKKNLDFFHKLMPLYELEQIGQYGGFQTVLNEQNKFQILQNITNPYRFKLVVTFNLSEYTAKQIFCLISEPQNATKINDNIEQQTVKTLLKSQNSAVMYQTLKAFNKFYRLRDFIFVRHAFTHNNNYYLIDKSLDNINFPPFITLVRGQISTVWGIIKKQKSEELTLIGDFIIVNSGLLNNQQQANLSLKYLNGFKQLLKKIKDPAVDNSMFDIDWNIDKKSQNKQSQQLRVRRKTLQIQKEKIRNKQNNISKQTQMKFSKKPSHYQQLSPQKIQPKNQVQEIVVYKKKSQSQIKDKIITSETNKKKIENQFHLLLQVLRNLDKQGFVIINKQYINKKFNIIPIQKDPYKQYPKINGHALWKGDWNHDQKNGGMLFINQKKIQDQKGVLKFVLTKIGKNILSGKSVLNISLPVDIFAPQSNLERLLIGMGYGPKLLQNLKQKSLIQKLIYTVAFGVTNSVLYINMEKPFNPILGQTFQCWINGCPGYAQQISHHPPIAALMFFGRGYKITCQLQSKVQLHMNSGCGVNDGTYRIQFDDGVEICFQTPGGQVSGLTYGDRKFNLVGKSYYWMQKERVFLQLNYDAGKKGFFSKQQKPSDYVQGKIYEVTPEFFNVFPKSKKRQPTEKQKVKELGKFEGIWNKYIKFNGKEIINFDNDLPLRIEYQELPLASDANWREDIEYRRLNKTTKAQTQKQRLQVVQRTDRKLRSKYHKH